MAQTTSKGTTKAKSTTTTAPAPAPAPAAEPTTPSIPAPDAPITTTDAAITPEAKPKAAPVLTPAQKEARELAEKLKALRVKAKEEADAVRAAKLAEHNAKVAQRKEDLAAKKANATAAKEAKVAREPDMVSQLDEHGNAELVDRNVFCHEIHCSYPGCNEIRYVTKSGLLEATMCKPHARKERRKRRLSRVKDTARNHKAIVEAAIAEGLFPESFLRKHGLI